MDLRANWPSEQLSKLHPKKRQQRGEMEFFITVKELVTPPDPTMRFPAQADKRANQKTAPFSPSGWGHTIYEAPNQGLKAIERFPYEGPAVA